MSFVRRFFFVTAVLATLLAWGGRARAQVPSVTGISGGLGGVKYVLPNGSDAPSNHPGTVTINTINYLDCTQDLRFQMQLAISGFNNSSSYTLQAWAGTQDCTALANRQAATAVCWQVAPNITAQNLVQVNIRAQDVLSQFTASTKTVTGYVPGTSDACTAQTTSGASTVNVYFFFVGSDGNPPAGSTSQPFAVTVDTVAPPVQGPLTVGVGDTLLVVNIPAQSPLDPDIKLWNIYIDPPAGADAAASVSVASDASSGSTTGIPTNGGVCPEAGGTVDDAGDDGGDASTTVDAATKLQLDALDGGDGSSTAGNPCGAVLNDSGISAGTGTGTATTAACNSTVLVNGGGTATQDEAGVSTVTGARQTDVPLAYRATQVNSTSTSANISGLTNGVVYTVAVAAQDAVGNVGPLLVAACGDQTTPTPVSDFWQQYRLDGGEAGGGFCSLRGVGGTAGSTLFTFGMLGAGIAWVRRRRKKS